MWFPWRPCRCLASKFWDGKFSLLVHWPLNVRLVLQHAFLGVSTLLLSVLHISSRVLGNFSDTMFRFGWCIGVIWSWSFSPLFHCLEGYRGAGSRSTLSSTLVVPRLILQSLCLKCFLLRELPPRHFFVKWSKDVDSSLINVSAHSFSLSWYSFYGGVSKSVC